MSYQEQFIEKIAPIIQKMAIKYGYKIASPVIGQACLESGYGTLFKAVNHNNFFGLKYRENRITVNNGFFKDGSTEQLPDGTSYSITDLWYHFDSMEAGVEAYFQFVNISRYSNLKTASTPLQYLTNIKEDGYATDIAYVQKVSNIIAKYNLTQYDTLKIDPEPKPISQVEIIKVTSTANTTVLQNRKIDWIGIHYSAGVNSKKGTARSIASYFAQASTKASADFIVDEAECVQYNPDITNRYCWAVGGSKYSSMTTSEGGRYYGIATNKNIISIEMCSKKKNTSTKNATDTDWYFEDEVLVKTIQLTRYLMKKYNIDANHVIMHHQVTGKICPNPFCVNESRLSNWNAFKAALTGQAGVPKIPQTPDPNSYVTQSANFQVQVLVNNLKIYNAPNGSAIGKRTGKGTFTIIETSNGYGKLKSGAGWIYLENSNYVKKLNEPINQPKTNTFQIKVKTPLNIRLSPNGEKSGKTCPIGTYTIVEEKDGWGLLKSYANSRNGWIILSSQYVIKI